MPGVENPDEFGSLDPSYRETVVAGYQFLEVQYIEIKYLVFSLSIEVAYVGSGDSHDPLSTVQCTSRHYSVVVYSFACGSEGHEFKSPHGQLPSW